MCVVAHMLLKFKKFHLHCLSEVDYHSEVFGYHIRASNNGGRGELKMPFNELYNLTLVFRSLIKINTCHCMEITLYLSG